MAAIAGSLAAVAALGKLSVGVFAVAMGAIVVVSVGRPWWRFLLVYLAALALTGVGLWIAAGQRLMDLGAFTVGAYQIISGYQEAMGRDPPPDQLWLFLAFPACAAIIAWAAWRSSLRWPSSRRIALAVVALVLGFALWKVLFVRGHVPVVFSTAVVSAFAVTGRSADRRSWLVSLLGLGIAFAGASQVQPSAYLNLPGSVRSLVTEARNVFPPAKLERTAQRTRERLRAQYRLEPPILAAIVGRTVHVDPWEAGVAYAYPEFRWAPLPVFQSYGAYTPMLDELNTDRLRSPTAPERILRQFQPADSLRVEIGRPLRVGEVLPITVDGRFRWFESPAATLETFCRYRQVAATDRWQVLERTGAGCGAPVTIATVQAAAGTTVPVPEAPAGAFIIARVYGLNASPLDRLRTILLKSVEWYATLDDTRYR
ncbi:MAG: hypothetical protein E6I94_05280, partial [Chloroflexi bacterium]